MSENRGQKKPFWKKWWFWVIVVVVVLGIFAGGGGDSEPAESQDMAEEGEKEPAEPQDTGEDKEPEEVQEDITQKHIYDSAEVKDVMNGSRTEKIGEYSVIKANSADVTEDNLSDWYFNYVEKNDFNSCFIVYTDKDNLGVYAIEGIVDKDAELILDEYGDYALGDTSKCTVYVPGDDGKLIKTEQTEQSKQPEEDNKESVPSEYKSALNSAESYSETMHMSKAAIYDQLTSEYGEKFSEEAAQYAVDNMVADWNENALKSAELYSETMYMSKAAIYDQLISEYGDKFTKEEAQYAIDNIVADWNENALKSAKNYQETMNMSPAAIYDQLISEYGDKFTEKEADYAVKHLE